MASPLGRQIAYLKTSNEKVAYQNSIVTVMEADGSNIRSLTQSLDRSARDIQWAGTERSHYFQYQDRGAVKIGYATLRGDVGEIRDDLGGLGLSRPYASGHYRADPDGTIVYTKGSPQRPADIAVQAKGQARHLDGPQPRPFRGSDTR